MSKHRQLAYGVRLPDAWVEPIQEFIATQASANFAVALANPTTIQIVAGADNDQVSVGISGKWRYNTATKQRAHPGGAAGTYDVWVVTADNNYAAGTPEVDNTDYSFDLRIVAGGAASPATGSGATAFARKVATVAWDGAAITKVTNLLGRLSGSDAIPWGTVHGYGTLAARPAANAGNLGYVYYAYDAFTFYRSNGATWDPETGGTSIFSAAVGDGVATSFTLTHGLNSQNVVVVVREAVAPFSIVDTEVRVPNTTQVTVIFDAPPAVGGYSVTVVGGVTLNPQNPAAHATTHLPGAADALAWQTINARGTYLTRPSPVGLAGLTYFATDTLGRWLSDGATWILIGQGRPLITPAAFAAAPFTTPYDAQEVRLLVDATNGVEWHLVYNAASASVYKWEWIGGTELSAFVEGGESTTSSAYTDLATVGPSITVPRGGDYLFELGTVASNPGNSGGGNGIAALLLAGSNTGFNVQADVTAIAGAVYSVARKARVPGVAASTVAKLAYLTSNGVQIYFGQRWLSARPVRIS